VTGPTKPVVAELVRAADHDRYLSALYAPREKRDALLALYAFNAEIAGVRDRIRDALPGEVRLQWWRDAIANRANGGALGHPVADALIATIDRCDLPALAFDNFIEARIFDLYNDSMPTRTDLEGYCGETAGALMQLAAMVLDAKEAPSFAGLAGHAGCAQAITGLLRLLPLHRGRGQCFVPRDILAAAGTSPEEFVARGSNAAAAPALAAMIALAGEHLAAFQAQARSLPESLRPAFLPAALVPAYLAALSKLGARALTEVADIPAWNRHWLLFRAASRGW
jgi:phytoene synthase